MTVFQPGSESARRTSSHSAVRRDNLRARFGQAFDAALESMELAVGASPPGTTTPSWPASRPGVLRLRREQLRVMEVLDAVVDMSPPPGPRVAYTEVNRSREEKTIQPEDKLLRRGVQGAGQHGRQPPRPHRLRARGLGQVHPGMKMKVQRTGKELRPTSVVTFMSQRREAVDEAYAGDIIGFTTTAACSWATPSPTAPTCSSPACPSSRPEMFMTVVLKNPLRTKQLQQGLMQLGEEGAIQVFKPDAGGNMLLGAVGQLQFEVVQHRLKTEYDCDVRLEGCQYTGARWITADTPAELREFDRLPAAHGA
jgi:peptide chain release factor 3